MASSFADHPAVRDIEFYKKLAQRDLELIEDYKKEIVSLKIKVNRLNQKIEQQKKALKRKC